jgi:branched-chain amino acid transport system permease protein
MVVVALGAFGVVFERIVVHDIIERSWSVHLVATLAASMILANGALLLFKSDARQVPTGHSTTFVSVLGSQTSVQRLVVLGVVVVVYVALRWFLANTWTGRSMRAISQNRETCAVVGIDVRRVVVVTFAISGALAGLASALLIPLFSVSPGMGSLITLKALAAVVMGGMGQVTGGFLAAFVIGLAESFFAAYIPSGFAYRDVASFGLLIAVLMLRPQGLFGRKVGI